MGKIKKILENELVGGTQSTDVYPVTSIKAVYDENNERLDHILNRRGVVNISTNYNDDHIAEVLTLSQAIAKVPSEDRVLGFQGNVLTDNGWITYKFIGTNISQWTDTQYWSKVIDSASLAQELGDSEDAVMSQKAVADSINSMGSKVRLIGDDNTLLSSSYVKGIIANHIYRITINPDIDVSGVTYLGGYDLFSCTLYNSTLDDKIVMYKKYVGETLEESFDIKVPEGYPNLRFGMRATKGAEQIIVITDVTEEYKNNLDLGKPVELVYSAYNKLSVYSEGLQYEMAAGILGVGAKVSELPTYNNSKCETISIDLPDNIAWLEVSNHYNTTSSFGSMLVDENDVVLNILVNRDHIADSMAVLVPPRAKKLLLSVINDGGTVAYPIWIKTKIICHPYSEYLKGVVKKTITSFMSASSLQTDGFYFNNPIIGSSIFNGMMSLINDGDAFIYLVPVYGYKALRCTHFRTSSNYGSAFVDENLNIVGSLVVKSYALEDERITETIIIPKDAKFLYYVWYKTMPVEIEPYVELQADTIGGVMENPNIWMNGDIVDGNIVKSTKSVLLPLISMDKGFHITLNEGYEFKSAHLYYNDSIVCADYYPNPRGGDGNIMSPFEYFDYRVFSINQILPQLSIRLVVIKSDGSEISPSELFIKEKTIINYIDFKRLESESIPTGKQAIARRRINQFLNLVWKAEEDIYPSNPNDYSNTHFKKGRTYISSIYSETSEFSKYLGWCVSFRTYLTALMNKRSVMYTERISQTNNKSEYGMSYAGLGNYYCNPYYGTVCTGLTQYALNLPNLYISGAYHSGGVPNTTKIDDADSSNVQPLDYLWNSGHCSIISDILLDEDGNRKFIVWAEQTFPVAKNTVYTLEEFDERCRVKEIEVWRYSKWDTVVEPEPTPYIQSSKWEWQTPLVVDKDFHLFCGDYAAFAKGDPIFFNANRGAGYSRMTVYNEEDNAMSTALVALDLSSLDNDGMYPEDGEDWVKIDFTSNSLPAGKYKARLASDTITSGFVHFEIVELNLSASLASDNNSTDISYSCSDNGIPVLIRQESQTGMYDGLLIISDAVKEKDVNVSWKDYSTRKFIKLYVKADYGIVVKRIDMSEQTE